MSKGKEPEDSKHQEHLAKLIDYKKATVVRVPDFKSLNISHASSIPTATADPAKRPQHARTPKLASTIFPACSPDDTPQTEPQDTHPPNSLVQYGGFLLCAVTALWLGRQYINGSPTGMSGSESTKQSVRGKGKPKKRKRTPPAPPPSPENI